MLKQARQAGPTTMLALLLPLSPDAPTRAAFVVMTVAPAVWLPGVLLVQAVGARYRRWRRRRAEEADPRWLPPARTPPE
jgi:hypothetical protein